MELSDNMTSLVGYLRSLLFLSLVSRIRDPAFPLDTQFQAIAPLYRRQYEESFTYICDLAQATDCYEHIAAALDELLSTTQSPMWDESNTTLQLQFLSSLCPTIPTRESFSFSELALFQNELAPIAVAQLQGLLFTIVWERVAYYQFFPNAQLFPNPSQRYTHLLRLLCQVTPAGMLIDPHAFIVSTGRTWLELDHVHSRLIEPTTESHGLFRVASELVAAFPGLSLPTKGD